MFRRVAAIPVALVVAAAAALLSPAAAQAAFPGVNGKIAYVHQVGGFSSIYSVNPNGGSPINLSLVGTGSSRNADFDPAWSANGRHLVFVRVDRRHCSGQIWTMSANGTHQRDLSKDAGRFSEFNPAYGPGGAIVFVRAAAGTFSSCSGNRVATVGNLWIREPNGTERQLTFDGGEFAPAWSPGGKKIAYADYRPPTRGVPLPPHIFVITADGAGAPKDLGRGEWPNWSPDGERIVFGYPGFVQREGAGMPLSVMNADGTHRRPLNAEGAFPAFSPDGRKIVYVAVRTPYRGAVGVMDADGRHRHRITSRGNYQKPDWQRIPPAHGRVEGSLVITGGKGGRGHCGCLFHAGTVVITSRSGRRRRIHVGRSGRFSVSLSPGQYRAVGGIRKLGWKLGSCTAGGPFRIRPHRTTRIIVDCRGR